MALQLDLTEDSAAADRLNRLLVVAEERGKDLKPAFLAIAGQFFREESRVFATGGAHGGRTPWPT